jgi:hypothetical protein
VSWNLSMKWPVPACSWRDDGSRILSFHSPLIARFLVLTLREC